MKNLDKLHIIDLIKFAKKPPPTLEMEDDKSIAYNIIEKALN